MSDSERSAQILDFLVFADQLKSVERRGYLGDHSRHDNPAEHSWHMMLCMLLLHQDMQEKIDLGHALKMALIHDIAEIYAGDVPVYDQQARREQQALERNAAEKLFVKLPHDLGTEAMTLWNEFADCKTPEAKFANACDYLQGFMQSYIAKGKSWQEMGITRSMTETRTEPIRALDPAFDSFISTLYERITEARILPDE